MGFIALPTDKLGAQSLVAEVEHGETLQRGVNIGCVTCKVDSRC